ncbi:MAG: hypothetical protein R2818_01920 [Flavobacteriales bacterium]
MGYYVAGRYKQWYDGDTQQDIKYQLAETNNRFQFQCSDGHGHRHGTNSFEVRAQTSLTPFSSTLQTQNIVYQAHLRLALPSEGEERTDRVTRCC